MCKCPTVIPEPHPSLCLPSFCPPRITTVRWLADDPVKRVLQKEPVLESMSKRSVARALNCRLGSVTRQSYLHSFSRRTRFMSNVTNNRIDIRSTTRLMSTDHDSIPHQERTAAEPRASKLRNVVVSEIRKVNDNIRRFILSIEDKEAGIEVRLECKQKRDGLLIYCSSFFQVNGLMYTSQVLTKRAGTPSHLPHQ